MPESIEHADRQLRKPEGPEDGCISLLDMRSGPYPAASDYLPMEKSRITLTGQPPARPARSTCELSRVAKRGITNNRTQAQIVMARVPAQIQSLLEGSATDSPFYKAFTHYPAASQISEDNCRPRPLASSRPS